MNQATQLQLRHRPLKLVYADAELRAKYRQNRLERSKIDKSIFIRFEPNQKYCKIQNKIFLNIIAPANYEMGYLIGTIKQKLMKNKAELNETQGIFLFSNNKLVTSFKQKIVVFWQKNKEEDNILYLEYADSAPF